ncbi:MAG: hypothetical protein ACI9UO_002282 [Nitrospinales bacterium]|jgi:hypothetical protein
MSTKRILKWATTGIFSLFVIPVFVLNIENFAKSKGWDQLLTKGGLSMLEYERWLSIPYLGELTAFFAGSAIAFWISEFLSKRESMEIKPDEQTPRSYEGITKLELLFFGDTRTPEPIKVQNIYNWYVLYNQLFVEFGSEQTKKDAVTNIFCVFTEPINLTFVNIKFLMENPPVYEVKDKGSRHLVLAVTGIIPAGKLEIDFNAGG